MSHDAEDNPRRRLRSPPPRRKTAVKKEKDHSEDEPMDVSEGSVKKNDDSESDAENSIELKDLVHLRGSDLRRHVKWLKNKDQSTAMGLFMKHYVGKHLSRSNIQKFAEHLIKEDERRTELSLKLQQYDRVGHAIQVVLNTWLNAIYGKKAKWPTWKIYLQACSQMKSLETDHVNDVKDKLKELNIALSDEIDNEKLLSWTVYNYEFKITEVDQAMKFSSCLGAGPTRSQNYTDFARDEDEDEFFLATPLIDSWVQDNDTVYNLLQALRHAEVEEPVIMQFVDVLLKNKTFKMIIAKRMNGEEVEEKKEVRTETQKEEVEEKGEVRTETQKEEVEEKEETKMDVDHIANFPNRFKVPRRSCIAEPMPWEKSEYEKEEEEKYRLEKMFNEQWLEKCRKRAEELKVKGNEYLNEGKYDEAIKSYSEAIAGCWLKVKDPELKCILYANRALAYIKKEKYDDAIYDCDRAVFYNHTYVKAFLRRGTARAAQDCCKSQDCYERALADFHKVLKLEPNNKYADDEIKRLKKAKDIYYMQQLFKEPPKPGCMPKCHDDVKFILPKGGECEGNVFAMKLDPKTSTFTVGVCDYEESGLKDKLEPPEPEMVPKEDLDKVKKENDSLHKEMERLKMLLGARYKPGDVTDDQPEKETSSGSEDSKAEKTTEMQTNEHLPTNEGVKKKRKLTEPQKR